MNQQPTYTTTDYPGLAGLGLSESETHEAAEVIMKHTAPKTPMPSEWPSRDDWRLWDDLVAMFQCGHTMGKGDFAAMLAVAMEIDIKFTASFWPEWAVDPLYSLVCVYNSKGGHDYREPELVLIGNLEEALTTKNAMKVLRPRETKNREDLTRHIIRVLDDLMPGDVEVHCDMQSPHNTCEEKK